MGKGVKEGESMIPAIFMDESAQLSGHQFRHCISFVEKREKGIPSTKHTTSSKGTLILIGSPLNSQF